MKQTAGFLATVEVIAERVELSAFKGSAYALARELCMIMAEIAVLPPDTPVRIGGAQLSAGVVAEVYGLLRYEHLEMVIDNFRRGGYGITHKKTYMRTALYNAAFEIETQYTSEIG